MTVIPVPIDTWVNEADQTANKVDSEVIRLSNVTSNRKRGFLWVANPAPGGSLIAAGGKLWVMPYGDWTGQTITVKRVNTLWSARNVNWNNKPTTDALHSVTTAAITQAAGANSPVGIDVSTLFQDATDGATYGGLELTVSGAVDRYLCSADFPVEASRPYLDLTWSVDIEAPVVVAPDGGFAISTNKPILEWDFSPDDPERFQASSRIQISTDPTFATTNYDSGMTANTLQNWDLTPSAFSATAGTTYYWRPQVTDDWGRVSDWGDAGSFVYQPLPGVTLTNPPVGGTVGELTPDIAHTITSGAQQALEIILTKTGEQTPDESDDVQPTDPAEEPAPAPSYLDADDNEGLDGADPAVPEDPPEELWRYSKVVTADTAIAVPEDLLDSAGIYQVEHRVYDQLRDQLANAPAAKITTRTFRYVRDGTPAPVTDLTFTKSGPGALLQWTYGASAGAAPDAFCLRVNGRERKHRIDPNMARVSGNQYEIWVWTLDPLVRNRVVVEAVTAKKHSKNNKRRYITPEFTGIYLVDPGADRYVRIRGIDTPDMQFYEVGTTFDIVGGDHPRRTVDALGGYIGSIPGDAHVRGAKNRDRMKRIKKRASSQNMRLAFADLNFPIVVAEMNVAPTALPPGNKDFAVGFQFFQSGEVKW